MYVPPMVIFGYPSNGVLHALHADCDHDSVGREAGVDRADGSSGHTYMHASVA
jgi:hypothetical protein